MSYSYLQAVFPKFEHSKVYDDKIYSSLDSVSTNRQEKNNKDKNELKKENTPQPIQEIETIGDPGIHKSEFKQLEKFQDNADIHQMHMAHILECMSCRNIMRKQFHLEDEKIFKEEVMELISFIAFGVFLIIFLDRTKK